MPRVIIRLPAKIPAMCGHFCVKKAASGGGRWTQKFKKISKYYCKLGFVCYNESTKDVLKFRHSMHLFGDIIRWVILMKNKEKEDKLMAVLSKPINLSFELDPKKAKKFQDLVPAPPYSFRTLSFFPLRPKKQRNFMSWYPHSFILFTAF